MTGSPSSLTLRFPGELLTAPDAASSAKQERPRIGWFLLNIDIQSASARYRCFHFAHALADQFDHAYFTRLKDLTGEIAQLDAIIIVKRLDQAVIDLAVLAQQTGKPIFLDLCDDLLHPLYPSREQPCLPTTALRAIAPALAGITVPSPIMAERVERYLAESGLAGCPCHVIPDIAETSELFAASAKFLTGKFPRAMPALSPPELKAGDEATPKRIVWFGNFGAVHSNFGIFSLKSRLRALRDFHQQIPLELVVISNSRPVFEALVHRCGFPTRFVPWSGNAVYAELAGADAALLTTGTDDFCDVKSSNRVIQALASGVPVIADKAPALAEFEDVIFSGSMRRCLELCLNTEHQEVVAARMLQARRLLARYTPETLARSWSTLLERAIGRTLVKAASARRSGPMLILAPGDNLDAALAAIKVLNHRPELDYSLLVSTELLETNPRFARVLHIARVLPNFYSGKLRGVEGMMARCSGLIIGNRNSLHGGMLVKQADLSGISVTEFGELGHVDFSIFANVQHAVSSTERAPPGPYPQRSNPDGSVDWAFVIHSDARGWILDAICQEIGSRQPASWRVVTHRSPPPPARNLFFSHFSLLDSFDVRFPEALASSNVFLWYTHPREETLASIARCLELFGRVSRVIFTCKANRDLWVERGLAHERTAVVLGAADPQLFQSHRRGRGCVGLSSSFYERKNPDLMVDVIKRLADRHFTLLGRNWNRYARFEELKALPNFSYVTAPYREYPRIYSTFDVFLSISNLEGGPIPLIEAMMCNAVPVASNVGFAPDLIVPGQNGFLFEPGADAAQVAGLIEQAFSLSTDIRASVAQYSWDQFSAQIMELAA